MTVYIWIKKPHLGAPGYWGRLAPSVTFKYKCYGPAKRACADGGGVCPRIIAEGYSQYLRGSGEVMRLIDKTQARIVLYCTVLYSINNECKDDKTIRKSPQALRILVRVVFFFFRCSSGSGRSKEKLELDKFILCTSTKYFVCDKKKSFLCCLTRNMNHCCVPYISTLFCFCMVKRGLSKNSLPSGSYTIVFSRTFTLYHSFSVSEKELTLPQLDVTLVLLKKFFKFAFRGGYYDTFSWRLWQKGKEMDVIYVCV